MMLLRFNHHVSTAFRITSTASALIFLAFATASISRAQSCNDIPQGGGESISAKASIEGTTTQLADGGFVPTSTRVRLDSRATAFGECIGMGLYCQTTPCVCQETGYVYQRTINHISVYVDISSTGWNGTYFVGNVGEYPFVHILDSESADSSGPLSLSLSYPGVYTFRFQAILNITPCDIQPKYTEEVAITLRAGTNDEATNNSKSSCETEVGKPVNVTNGNMYLQQTDYRLPGIGEGLELTRTYNSRKQSSGLFGVGWSSILDESVVAYGNLLVRLNLPDGRAVYFARDSATGPFDPLTTLNFHGQIAKNPDNTYTLTFRDGSIHQFNANGKLTSLADRNGNTITLTLNGSGNPITITDASGRTVALTYDSQSQIASISDSLELQKELATAQNATHSLT